MIRRFVGIFSTVCLTATVAAVVLAAQQKAPAPAASGSGWQLPPEADTTKSPLTVEAKVLAAGKGVYKDKCQKCHGAAGLGDGPDADPELQDDMNLTNPRRADRNTDGVVFYKIWNGRKKPKMPAQNADLTKEQVWSVVAYVQTLRRK
jgi:mono/diheme cytochrome c family protein